MGELFGMRALPNEPRMTAWLFMEMSMESGRPLRAAVVLDAALSSFDSERDGARQSQLVLLDARLKEARRQRQQERSIRIDSWILPRLAQ